MDPLIDQTLTNCETNQVCQEKMLEPKEGAIQCYSFGSFGEISETAIFATDFEEISPKVQCLGW